MRFAKIGLLLCCLAVAAVAGVYLSLGCRPLSSLINHGGTIFLAVAKDDDRLSPSMRRVLAGNAGTPTSGDFRWQETQPGFAVGELPVLVDGTEVDRLLVAKADPARFRVIARNDPSGSTAVDRWRHDLAAVLVVNVPGGRLRVVSALVLRRVRNPGRHPRREDALVGFRRVDLADRAGRRSTLT